MIILLLVRVNINRLKQWDFCKMNSTEIQKLIQCFSRLPGLGPRSGRRIALHLLKKKETIFKPLLDVMLIAQDRVSTCQICYNLDTNNPCFICTDPKRDASQLCIVEDVADLWAIERAKFFRGYYHVLGGVLSAIDGVGPSQLTTAPLLERVEKSPPKEILLALNATLDGQTTIHYLLEILKPFNTRLSTLAHGVPMGAELDYLDDGTLSTAFIGRQFLSDP